MPEPLLIANGVIGPDGTLAGPHLSGEGIIRGEYEVLMAFGGFDEAKPDQPAFLHGALSDSTSRRPGSTCIFPSSCRRWVTPCFADSEPLDSARCAPPRDPAPSAPLAAARS